MTDQPDPKAKRDEKDYKVEFSFSFDGIADQVGKMFGGVGEAPIESHHRTDLENATSAKIKLGASAGKFTVGALDLPGTLITVDSLHVGNLEFVVSRRDDETSVRLEPQSFNGFRSFISSIGRKNNHLHTDVELSPVLPINLTIDGSISDAHLDLRGLHLTQLKAEAGIGPMVVYLPDSDEGYKTYVEGGVGPIKVYLPAQNPAKIKVEGGIGPLSVIIPADADLDLSVEGGLGPVSVIVPEGTALQVKKESGLGGFKLPDMLRRGSKDDTYFTEGYDLAQRSVRLFLEGGVGPVNLRFGTEAADAEASAEAKAKRKNDEE